MSIFKWFWPDKMVKYPNIHFLLRIAVASYLSLFSLAHFSLFSLAHFSLFPPPFQQRHYTVLIYSLIPPSPQKSL